METRANYLLVGSFVLCLALASLGFVLWIAKVEWDAVFQRYQLIVEGSVTGLSPGSAVRYSGVRVGEVVDIRLDRAAPDQVVVTIEVETDAPVKGDTIASLELEGLTGGRYVLLSGGSIDAGPPQAQPGRPHPVIATRRSSLEQVLEGAPNVLAALNQLLTRGNRMLSDDNIAAVSNTIANLNAISSRIAARGDQIDSLIVDASTTMSNLNDATAVVADLARDLRQDSARLVERADRTLAAVERAFGDVGGDAKTMMVELRRAAESLRVMSEEVTAMVAENREPIRDFTSSGLYELANLLADTRDLVNGLNRMTTEVQRDPARFLFGDPQSGYEGRQE